MNKTIFITGSILGLLAVLFGAFGAHGLENILSDKELQTFETGVRYQMYHALFLLILPSLKPLSDASKKWVFYLITVGTFLFSFSIYGLATNALTTFDFKSIALLTPIGGTLLLLGWGVLGYQGIKHFK